MRALFTTSDSLLSRLIRRQTGEDCSHAALGIGDVVIHMNLRGLQVEPVSQFLQHSRVVHDAPLQLEPHRALAHIAKCFHARYDVGALAYLGLRTILPILPRANLWQASGMYLCTEFLTSLLDGAEDHLTTPHQLYLRLVGGTAPTTAPQEPEVR